MVISWNHPLAVKHRREIEQEIYEDLKKRKVFEKVTEEKHSENYV